MAEDATPLTPARTLRGTPGAAGMGRAPAFLGCDPDTAVPVRRITPGSGPQELARLAGALAGARHGFEGLRESLRGRLSVAQVRRFGEQALALKDPVLLSDVEALVLGERLGLESAIAKVLLEVNAVPGQADDWVRGAATCLLRQLVPGAAPTGAHVFVGRTLSLCDLAPPPRAALRGVVIEADRADSFYVSLLSSLAVPLITGVAAACNTLRGGEELTVDGDSGRVTVRPAPPRSGDEGDFVIDTPAAYFSARSHIGGAVRVLVDLDRLHALWLGLEEPQAELHPSCLEALAVLVDLTRDAGKSLCVFGTLAADSGCAAALRSLGVDQVALAPDGVERLG
jgi:signal transduction protein with GAF and PtsI domain